MSRNCVVGCVVGNRGCVVGLLRCLSLTLKSRQSRQVPAGGMSPLGTPLKTVLGGSESVINIRDNKLEKMIDEILKKTHYSSPIEYLEDRIKRDHATVMRNKKIG